MAVNLLFNEIPQFLNANGAPLSGGLLFFYAAGSSTKQDTFTTLAGTVPNANPMVLDSSGRTSQAIWGTTGLLYKIGLAVSTETDPPSTFIWTLDNVSAITSSAITVSEWQASGFTPTYISATSFSVPGDQTSVLQVGRRLKIVDSGGTKYATITASVFGAVTTVTVLVDSGGSLATPVSSFSYGILSITNPSIPFFLPLGAAGTIPVVRSASKVNYSAALGKTIYGLTYDHGTDTTNDFNINVGGAMDATNSYWMTLATALGKQSDVAWAVGGTTGAPAGWLDTGAVGNNDYYIWLIARSDTGVVDSLCSLSATAPTMPTNYDFKRLIGYFKRFAAANTSIHTYETDGGGLELLWDFPTLDINLAATLTTTRRTDGVRVPINFSVVANLNISFFDTAASQAVIVYCPDQGDLAPTNNASNLSTLTNPSASVAITTNALVRTSAAGLVASRATVATIDNFYVSTLGFIWSRRN